MEKSILSAVIMRRFRLTGLLLLFFVLGYSQSFVRYEDALESKDPKVIAAFIKQNPQHPSVPEFKRKIVAIVTSADYKVAPPVVEKLSRKELEKQLREEVRKQGPKSIDPNAAQAVRLLNHLFSNDPNKKEAYVQIENLSRCNLIVKFEGKDFYNLNVPANGKSFILINKGKYILSTNVCDAVYKQEKNIQTDIAIKLNAVVR